MNSSSGRIDFGLASIPSPASSTGFSKAKQERILAREGGSGVSAERERWVKYPPDERSRATGDEAAHSAKTTDLGGVPLRLL